MKTTRFILAISVLAGITLLSGCEKSGLGQGDKVIQFTASSESKGLTKSEYSGEGTFADGLLTWERINWKGTDEIRVASNEAYMQDPGNGGLPTGIHYADYKLRNIQTSTDKKKSTAIMAPYIVNADGTGSNGLVWKDGASHDFYAVYPCPYTNTNIALGSGDDNTTLGQVTAFLPTAQTLLTGTDNTKTRYVSATGAVADASGVIFESAEAAGPGALTYTVYQPDMSYAFMTAKTTGVKANTDGVILSFNPAYTAFEFCITTQGEELTVTKIELLAAGENDFLAGEYSLTAGADFNSTTVPSVTVTNTTEKPASQTVSMDLGEGLPLTSTTGVSLTLFTIPKANAGVITLKLTTTDGVVTLPMKSGSDPYVFAPGKKHRINCLKVADKWVFEAVELGLKWDVDEESLTYASDPIINAGALYEVSGAEVGWSRTAAAFAGPLPIVEYFTVFSPKNGNWVVTNSNASKIELSATGATSTVDEETGAQTLTGPINGRVDLTINRIAAGTADLNFYVKVGDRLYSINTEVTRGGAQVITVPNN